MEISNTILREQEQQIETQYLIFVVRFSNQFPIKQELYVEQGKL